MLEAGHEKRADRAVDQARGQRLLLGRTRLTLEEAAGHLAGRIVFFLVMDGQREEVLPGLLFLGEGHVGHDARLAQRGDDRAVGLTGDLARFQSEGFFPPLHRFLGNVEHSRIPKGALAGPPASPVCVAAPLPPPPYPLARARGLKASRLR